MASYSPRLGFATPPKAPIPIISGMGEASYGLQNGQGPSKQKPILNFGEKEAWAYPGTAQIFWIP